MIRKKIALYFIGYCLLYSTIVLAETAKTLSFWLKQHQRSGTYSYDEEKKMEVIVIHYPVIYESNLQNNDSAEYAPLIFEKEIKISRYPHQNNPDLKRINFQIKDLTLDNEPLSLTEQKRSQLLAYRIPLYANRSPNTADQFEYFGTFGSKHEINEANIKKLISLGETLLNNLQALYQEKSQTNERIKITSSKLNHQTTLNEKTEAALTDLMFLDQTQLIGAEQPEASSEATEGTFTYPDY